MKSSKVIICCLLNTVLLSSCSTIKENSSKPPMYKMVTPVAVSLLTDKKSLPKNYTIIGTATVSRLNKVGIKRQKAVINDHLREIAAGMGGDAVINLSSTSKEVSGIVITLPSSNLS